MKAQTLRFGVRYNHIELLALVLLAGYVISIDSQLILGFKSCTGNANCLKAKNENLDHQVVLFSELVKYVINAINHQNGCCKFKPNYCSCLKNLKLFYNYSLQLHCHHSSVNYYYNILRQNKNKIIFGLKMAVYFM